MPAFELLSIGIATAFILGVSNFHDASLTGQDKLKETEVNGNLFLAHIQSLGALYENFGIDNPNTAASTAYASARFDEDVECLLDNAW
ncbi:hypothetical protein MMC28_003531 [Mycoblastus sanguinarius]|nr:hypothetical protein [Mycoblastus sanguinarius]